MAETTRTQGRKTPGANVQAVEAAVSLLRAVAGGRDLGLSEVARRAGLAKARAYRLLRTLEAHGLLAQSKADATWRLGLGCLQLGEAAREQIDLARLAAPVLSSLGAGVRETALLRIRDGVESVCIATWMPDRELRSHVAIGGRRPLHIGSGKVLLAFAPEEVRREVIAAGLRRFTEHTVTEPDALLGVLARIRRNGFMVSAAELGAEAGSVAAPVRDAGGQVVAVVGLSPPLTRMGRAVIGDLVRQTREAAVRLSALLGFIEASVPRSAESGGPRQAQARFAPRAGGAR